MDFWLSGLGPNPERPKFRKNNIKSAWSGDLVKIHKIDFSPPSLQFTRSPASAGDKFTNLFDVLQNLKISIQCWHNSKAKKMSLKTHSVWLLSVLALSVSASPENRCSTLSCVHSSAAIIQRLNSQVNPCDDFYEYACGTFIEEQHTPDEKSTVDTISLMSEKLTEYLLTLLLKPSDGSEPKLHKLAKTLFNSCLNLSKLSPSDDKTKLKINFNRSNKQTRQGAGRESSLGDRALADARG